MKALFVALCVLAAFIVCSETLRCYECSRGSVENCEQNATIQNCTHSIHVCFTRTIFLTRKADNQTLEEMAKGCILTVDISGFCNPMFVTRNRPVTFVNCTSPNCTSDLCNISPRTTTPMPVTSAVSTTNVSSTRLPETSWPPLTTDTSACPTSSCGKQSFYSVIALVLLMSLAV